MDGCRRGRRLGCCPSEGPGTIGSAYRFHLQIQTQRHIGRSHGYVLGFILQGDSQMQRIARFASTWLLLAIAGCVSDEAHRYYATERFPPRNEKEVEVLKTAPSRPYDVIADFQARGASPEYMRRRAAEIGADAVIVGTFGGYRARSDDWASEDKYGDTYSRITGTAIRFRR